MLAGRSVLAWTGTLTLLFACGATMASLYRLSRAETQFLLNTPESVQAAIALAPENAEYHVRFASFLGARGVGEIATAVRLNPDESMWWVEASVIQEMAGDTAEAEKSLKRAASVSRYSLPRMMLASFYFRQHDAAKFAEWTKQALSIGVTSPMMLYQMARQLGFSPHDLASSLTPDRLPALVGLVEELIASAGSTNSEVAEESTAELFDAAQRLIRVASVEQSELDLVLRSCDILFGRSHVRESALLWNELIARGWLGRRRIEPDGTTELDFSARDLKGFDWQPFDSEGTVANSGSNGGLHLEFSGSQPEHFKLMSHRLALLPSRKYRITFRATPAGIAPDSGLAWVVNEGGPSASDPSLSAIAPSGEAVLDLETSATQRPYTLELWYERRVGMTRISGSVDLDSPRISALP